VKTLLTQSTNKRFRKCSHLQVRSAAQQVSEPTQI
jgi:hypothetical protein